MAVAVAATVVVVVFVVAVVVVAAAGAGAGAVTPIALAKLPIKRIAFGPQRTIPRKDFCKAVSLLLFNKTDTDVFIVFWQHVEASDTRTHSAEMLFEVVQKQRDLNMFAYLFLASLEPGCNEHQRTLILPASCAYMRRSRPAENLRITPKLQVYFTNIFGFLNKAPLVATCCPPCNQTMFLLQHVWLHTKKRLIFAVVAKSRITQMFAVCSEERMKNANTQHFQPFRRNVAYYVALLKQLFDVFFCPYRLFGQVPKHKLNASTQPLSTNYINDIR